MTDTAETSNKEATTRITQYLGYVGPLIIFLGMARLMSFYGAFGISIISYLEFSEIITSFFDILFFVVLIFACTSINNFLTRNKNDIEEADKRRQELLTEADPWKLLRLYFNYLGILIISGLVVTIGCCVSHFLFNGITSLTLLIAITIFIFFIIFTIVSIEIDRKHIHFQSSISRRWYIFLTLYCLTLIMGVTYYSSYQANLIKNDKSTFGVSIILDNNQKIISDSTNYYIGKTQNYLFIYHEALKTTDVFPMSRVKQMTMPNRRDE